MRVNFMVLFCRLVMVTVAFLAACLVASAFLLAAFLFPEISGFPAPEPGLLTEPGLLNKALSYGFFFILTFALVPAAILASVSEAAGLRSPLLYALGGAAIGAASILFLVSFNVGAVRLMEAIVFLLGGAAAGLTYWAAAGRNAGAWRQPSQQVL